jgi:2-dehydropantoate 2-reductase
MKLCVFGAGAVGGHIAAKLAASGEDVSVVARGAHLEAIKRNGLKLLHGPAVITGKVRASENPEHLGPQDMVLVTLKANQLGDFADAAAPLLGPDTAVAFVQNGIPWWYAKDFARLDPGGKLARAIEPRRVLGGVAYSANIMVEPGVIRNNVPGNNMIVVGETDCSNSGRVSALRKILERADLSSPPVEDIRQSIWAKLLQNLGTSSLCTLMGVTVGEVRADPSLAAVAARLGAEGRAIAGALGVAVERAPMRPAGGQSAGPVMHKPSMLQDYERGKAMEIDAQLAAPLEFARSRGVAAPTLESVTSLVIYRARAKGLYT